jgi:hypothetical protein
MRLNSIGLVGLVVLVVATSLFVSACILVPVDDGRGRDRGDRGWHGDGRDRHDDRRR